MKHLYQPQPNEDPFHSHGIAKISHGGGVGATSSETYRQRLSRDGERQYIQRYKDAHVVRHRTVGSRYQTLTDSGRPEVYSQGRQKATEQRRERFSGGGTQAGPRFSEPPQRYNPYG